MRMMKKMLRKPYNKMQDMIKAQDNNKQLNKYLRNVDLRKLPVFNWIEIETMNRCNGSCRFCPVNKNDDQRPYAKMSEDLFLKIIKQLQENNYSGYIGLYSNNEPFLDNRIEKFIMIAKEYLPDACHYIITNGTLLTLERFKLVIDSLDRIIIDNYDNAFEFHKNVKDIYLYCLENDELRNKVRIVKRSADQVLTSRGGTAPNREKFKVSGWLSNVSCQYPFSQMIVRPDGKVSLCCNDALGYYTLGDLNKQSLSDVWNNQDYYEIRKKIIRGRKNIEICRGCDTIPFDWLIKPSVSNFFDKYLYFFDVKSPYQ